MSLVVVGNDHKNNFVIVSDTKLTFPNDNNYDERGLKNHISSGTIEYSVLKSTIINEKICISFAGNIGCAEHALNCISKGDSLEKVKNTLMVWHNKSGYDTDFILCSLIEKLEVHLIQGNKIENVTGRQMWIGDGNAHTRFQKSRILYKKSILASMDDVINDDKVETVGGFKIVVEINRGNFTYGFSMLMVRESMNVTLRGGVPHIIGHGTAEKGAYTLCFIGSSKDYQHIAYHMKQGQIGIVYSRTDNGLLRPTMKRCIDEVDFHDYIISKFQIFPPFCTQDRFQKFFSDGIKEYKQLNFSAASISFNKAEKETKDKKAEVQFYRGCCFHFLKQPAQAMTAFQSAISLDSRCQKQIVNFLYNNRTL